MKKHSAKPISKVQVEYAIKYNEYLSDPVKFMEECVYIPTPGGSTLIKLYEPQKRVIENFFKHHFLILLKSRQIGMSTICQAIITYIFTFYENCVVGIVSRDGGEASDFSRKVQDMIDRLPDWIRPKYKNRSIQQFHLENGCKLYSSAISPANPGSVFRSKSITLLIVDEAAHIRNISEAWTGMASTLSKTQLEADKRNIPYGTIILSTPNKTFGVGRWFYEMWISANNGENNFIPLSIHWSEIPDFANDPTWYETQCKLLNNDKNRIAQELELKFVGSEDSLFSEEVQIELQEIARKTSVKYIQVPGTFGSKIEPIHCFVDEIDPYEYYLIGVDCATAVGKDYSAIEVMNYRTGEQVLEFRGHLDPKQLLLVIKYIAQCLCPNNVIIIENTGGYGHTLIYDLFYDEYNFNLFSEKDDLKSALPGLPTNAKTRPLILDSLYTHVSEHPECVKSPRLSAELISLVGKTGRIEADKGFHDDLAFAFAFCCYVRKYHSNRLNVDELTEEELNEIRSNSSTISLLLELNKSEDDNTILGQECPTIRELQQKIFRMNLDSEDLSIEELNEKLEKYSEDFAVEIKEFDDSFLQVCDYDKDDIDLL